MRNKAVLCRWQLWSPLALAVASFLAGVLSYIVVLGVATSVILNALPAMGGSRLTIGAVYVLLIVIVLAVPCIFAWRFQEMVCTNRRAILSGAGFGTGVICPVAAFSLGNWDARHWASVTAAAVGSVFFFALLNLALRFVFNRIRPPRPMQDGTLCPGCAYSLIGNETMVCPECGKAFTFEELGTTEREFRRRRGH